MTRCNLSVILIISVFLLITCSGEKTNQVHTPLYPIDSTKISAGALENDLHISFNPPVKWLLSESELSNQLIQSGNRKFGNSGFVYKPLRLYLNKFTNSTLFLGKVVRRNDPSQIKHAMDEYKKVLRSIYSDEITAERDFQNQNLELTEFRIKKKSIYSYKLLFEDKKGNIIQLDYTTLEKYLPKEKAAIESSISTIRLL